MFLSHLKKRLRALFAITFMLVSSQAVLASTHSVDALRADFTQLYQSLQEAHFDVYANLSKQQYDNHFTEYLAGITQPMTDAEARLYFQRFVALGDVAHANIALPVDNYLAFRENGGRSLPLFPAIRGKRIFVDTYYGAQTDLRQGTEITAIDGIEVATWLTRFAGYISADNPTIANTLIEARFPYLMWLEEGEKQRFSLRIVTERGPKTVHVNALTSAQQQQFAATQPADDTDYQQPDYSIVGDNTGYLRPGPFYNTTPGAKDLWDATAFHTFIDDAFGFFLENDVDALIIDLRNNPGGTNSFSDHMIAWIADRPFRFASDFIVRVSSQAEEANKARLANATSHNDISHQFQAFYDVKADGEVFSFDLPFSQPRQGRRFEKPVYVLINRYSYSNAVNTAAIFQDYGFGTVIGEKTSDLATTYGAMEHFDLKNTGIEVGFPKALIVRPNGDRKPDGVIPDIPLDLGQLGLTHNKVMAMTVNAIKQHQEG